MTSQENEECFIRLNKAQYAELQGKLLAAQDISDDLFYKFFRPGEIELVEDEFETEVCEEISFKEQEPVPRRFMQAMGRRK